MAGERMVSICSQNMLPMEAQAVEQSRLWSVPVLYAPLFFLKSLCPHLGTPVVLGPQGDRMCPAAH